MLTPFPFLPYMFHIDKQFSFSENDVMKIAFRYLKSLQSPLFLKKPSNAFYRGITLRVDGAADSGTGTIEGNLSLSKKRASYICKQLMKRGVPSTRIKVFAHGGVNEHDRPEEDRYSRVSVYFEKP